MKICECCGNAYKSITDDSVRCEGCCLTCCKPEGSQIWIQGPSCPAKKEIVWPSICYINYRKGGDEVCEAFYKYRAEKPGLAHVVDFVAGWNACLAAHEEDLNVSRN